MRILQVHNAYRNPGGEDISVATEAAALRAAGHEVRELTVRNPDRPAVAIGAVVRAPHNRAAARHVVAAAAEFRPDVAHVNNTWFSLSPLVVEALADRGVPTALRSDFSGAAGHHAGAGRASSRAIAPSSRLRSPSGMPSFSRSASVSAATMSVSIAWRAKTSAYLP